MTLTDMSMTQKCEMKCKSALGPTSKSLQVPPQNGQGFPMMSALEGAWLSHSCLALPASGTLNSHQFFGPPLLSVYRRTVSTAPLSPPEVALSFFSRTTSAWL